MASLPIYSMHIKTLNIQTYTAINTAVESKASAFYIVKSNVLQ